jgi:hypothetical protein
LLKNLFQHHCAVVLCISGSEDQRYCLLKGSSSKLIQQGLIISRLELCRIALLKLVLAFHIMAKPAA